MTAFVKARGASDIARSTAAAGCWRDALVHGLGLNGDTFQLFEGAASGHPAVATQLFELADIRPPDGPVMRFGRAAARPRWSDGYRALLDCLLPETETGLRGLLGPHYSAWIAHRDATADRASRRALFREWAGKSLRSDRVPAALRAYHLAGGNAHGATIDAFDDLRFCPVHVGANGRIGRMPRYSATVDAARAALSVAGPARLDFRCMSPFGPLEDDAASPADGAVAEMLASPLARLVRSRISISGQIGRHALLPVHPGGWFDQSQIDRAWGAPDDPTVWDEAAGRDGWTRFFGSQGALARRYGQLLVASEIDLTLTSHAQYTAAEAGVMAARIARGGRQVLPVLGSARGTACELMHNADGGVTLRVTSLRDRIHVWGGTVLEAPL